MTKPVIAIDVDDVLAVSALAFVEFSNERWGTTLTIDDYHDDWVRLWKLDREHAEDIEIVSKRAGEFFTERLRTMAHDEQAYEVLKHLNKNYELIVVTARKVQTKGDTLAWIQERFEGIFTEDAIFFAGFYDTLTKDSVTQSKGDLLKELGASYVIDDQPKHCNGAAKHGIQAILFGHYGWHRDELLNDSVVNLKSWLDIKDYFDAEQKRISQ